MPRFNYDPPTQVAPESGSRQKYGVETVELDYKHSIVSSKKTDLSALLTVIEGSSYNVDYYSQILNHDDEPRPYDDAQSATQQQYQRIDNYELKLQGGLVDTISPEDGRLVVTGTAMTYPHLKPNPGDMFIGDIGDGKAGLFSVTELHKKTRFEQTTYEIDFTLNRVMTADDEKAIDKKVVKETKFVKDYIKFGQDPVLTTEHFNAGRELNTSIGNLLDEYLAEFYSFEYDTLLVPSSGQSVYDPFIVRLILRLFGTDEHRLITKISQLNTDDSRFDRYINLWDLLVEQDIRALDKSFKEVMIVPTTTYSHNVFLQTIAYSGIDLIVMPITNGIAIDDVLKLSECIVTPSNVGRDTNTIDEEEEVPEEPVERSVPNVEGTLSYILSPEFYGSSKTGEDQSDFENLVKRYLNEEHLDYKELLGYYNDKDTWTSFQRFYLIPVLMILMIYKHRSL